MEPVGIGLFISAFVAGVFMFLAPCTLPLVPGYLGFISGIAPGELSNPAFAVRARRRILWNGVFFVLGFTLVFIFFGAAAGLLGGAAGPAREWLARAGGVLIILFGLFMLGVFRLPALESDRRVPILRWLSPGKPTSSLLIGSAFAFGWTPCVGPILATILLLASASATAGQGALLLFVFSLGLALPFLALAIAFSTVTGLIERSGSFLLWASRIGGVFLIVLGILLLTGTFGLLNGYAFRIFGGYEAILDFL